MQTTPRRSTRRAHRSRRLAGSLVVAGLVLGACGAPPSSGGGGGGREDAGGKSKLPTCPLDALKKAKGKVKVDLWFSGLVSPPSDVLEDMVKRFNASQDKVVVTANNQGNAYAEGLRKYEGASATPDQVPDMQYLEDTMLGELVDKGQVLPAQSCMEADDFDIKSIIPSARASYSVDGVLWPAYMNVSTPVIYYNKIHFQKAGLDPNKPPTTIEEAIKDAKIIKDKGVAPKPFAFLANEWFFDTWAAGIGQDVVNNDNGRTKVPTKATFNTPEMQGVLKELDQANKDGLLNPFPVTDGSIDHYLSLVTGQSSMVIETSTASGTIAQVLGGDLTAEDAGIDFDASAIDTSKVVPASGAFPGIEAPGKVYASGGAFYMMNTGSPAQQAASWEFMKFMLQPDNARTWHIKGGYLPTLKSIADDPEVKKYQNTALDGLLLKPAVEQLATADPDEAGPLVGPFTQFQKAVRGAMEGVLFSKKDPKDALSKAQSDMDKVLKDYNGD